MISKHWDLNKTEFKSSSGAERKILNQMKKNPRKCIILRWVACTEDLIFDKKYNKKEHKENHLLRNSDQDYWNSEDAEVIGKSRQKHQK